MDNENLDNVVNKQQKQETLAKQVAKEKIKKKAKKQAKKATKKAAKAAKNALVKPIGVTLFSGCFTAFIVVFMLIGIVSFIFTMPGLVQEKLLQTLADFASKVGYFINGDDYYLEELAKDTEHTKQKEVLKYLDDMGIDPVGFGFAPFYTKDENGEVSYDVNITAQPIDEVDGLLDAIQYNKELAERVKKEDLIFKYIVSNERTYLLDKVGLLDAVGEYLYGIDFHGMLTTSGIDDSVDSSVSVDRENKTLVIDSVNWSEKSKQTFTYNLEGFAGRYGTSLELLLALHIATMSSDLTDELITNNNLITEVEIDMEKDTYNIDYDISYDGKELPIKFGNEDNFDDLYNVLNKYTKIDENGKCVVEIPEEEKENVKNLLTVQGLMGWIDNFSWIALDESVYSSTLEAKQALVGDDTFRVVRKYARYGPEENYTAIPWTNYFGMASYSSDYEDWLNGGDDDYRYKYYATIKDLNGNDSWIMEDPNFTEGNYTWIDDTFKYLVKEYIYTNPNNPDYKYRVYALMWEDSEYTEEEYNQIKEMLGWSSYPATIMHGLEYYKTHPDQLRKESDYMGLIAMLSQMDTYLYLNKLEEVSGATFTKAKHPDDYNTEAEYILPKLEISSNVETQYGDDGWYGHTEYYILLTKEWLDFIYDENGNLVLQNKSQQEIIDKVTELQNNINTYFDIVANKENYFEEACKSLFESLEMDAFSIEDIKTIYAALKDEAKTKEVEYVIPRIKKVIKHWYKDIIFEENGISVYQNTGGTIEIPYETENESLEITAKLTGGTKYTQKGEPYVIKGDIVTVDGEIVENPDINGETTVTDRNGESYTLGDGYRTSKKLFTQGRYYAFDGTPETAKSIWYAKELENVNKFSIQPKFAKVSVSNGRIVSFCEFSTSEFESTYPGVYDNSTNTWNESTQIIHEERKDEDLGEAVTQGDGWSVFLANASISKLNDTTSDINVYYIKINKGLVYMSPAKHDFSETIASVERINGALTAMGVTTLRKEISFDNVTEGGDVTALTAFSILENMKTDDAQLIYRDLKEFLIELGYYTKAEFEYLSSDVLTWFIPDYIPESDEEKIHWAQNKDEDMLLYGAVIYPKEIDENGKVTQEGFITDLEVVAPGNCKILDCEENIITLEFDGISQPEIGMLDKYTMIIEGIEVNKTDVIIVLDEDGVTEIEMTIEQAMAGENIVKAGAKIGITATDKIRVVLKDNKGSFVNNIEDYMGPKIEVTAGEIYSGTLSEKLYYYLAVNMEGFTNPEDEYLVGENGKDNDYGFVTVGPGLLMDDGKVKSYIEKGGTYTEGMNKEVGSLWDKDIILEMYIEYVDTTFATTVVEMLDGYEVSQTQMEALVCAAYQLGTSASSLKTRIDLIKAGANADQLYSNWVRPWNDDYSSDNPYPGVYARRYSEWYLYKYGKYINVYSNSITGDKDTEYDFGSETPYTDFLNGY